MNKKKYFMIGSLLFSLVCLVGIMGLFFAPDYQSIDLLNIESPPSPDHILGTDDIGRDVFNRLVFATGLSIGIGLLASLFQILIGLGVGLVAGYFGGRIDFIMMRLVDVVMCFPMFLIASAIAAALGPSLVNLVAIIALLSWPGTARIVRADVIRLREEDFVLASRLAGFSSWEIIHHHLLPNVLPNLTVSATLSMANAILMEASLSFLGLGVKLPMPSLGNMLSSAQNLRALQTQWWTWLPAGIMIILLVLSINLIGESLAMSGERGQE